MQQANQSGTTTEYEYVDEDNELNSSNSVFLLSVSAGEDSSQESLDESNQKRDLKRVMDSSQSATRVKRKLTKGHMQKDYDRTPDNDTGERVEDRFDVFGRLVAIKMRGLPHEQMILAEKLINDTLHEAELGMLNRYCGLNLVQVHMVDESKRDVLSTVSSNN